MSYYLDYIVHFFKSNSRHGTHSPFVYAMAEDAIYRAHSEENVKIPELYREKRWAPLLGRIISYLDIDLVDVFEKKSCNIPFFKSHNRKLLIVESSMLGNMDVGKYLSRYYSILVVGQYRDFVSKDLWAKVYRTNEVTVSIDLFHFGLLLNRPVQEKEHFRLRYPFWLE